MGQTTCLLARSPCWKPEGSTAGRAQEELPGGGGCVAVGAQQHIL